MHRTMMVALAVAIGAALFLNPALSGSAQAGLPVKVCEPAKAVPPVCEPVKAVKPVPPPPVCKPVKAIPAPQACQPVKPAPEVCQPAYEVNFLHPARLLSHVVGTVFYGVHSHETVYSSEPQSTVAPSAAPPAPIPAPVPAKPLPSPPAPTATKT
jgi:hypothetical protein